MSEDFYQSTAGFTQHTQVIVSFMESKPKMMLKVPDYIQKAHETKNGRCTLHKAMALVPTQGQYP